MAAVSRAERVVYEYFRVVCESFAEILFLALFFPMETKIFQKHSLAVLERVALCLSVCPYNVGSKSHFAAEQLVEPLCHGRKSEFFGFVLFGFFYNSLFRGFARFNLFLVFLIELYLVRKYGMRFAHVRAKSYLRAVVEKVFNGGQRAVNSVFVGYCSVFHGYVEIATHKHLFALYVNVLYAFLVHYCLLFRFIF